MANLRALGRGVQLPEMRVRRRLPRQQLPQHEAEAVYVGLHSRILSLGTDYVDAIPDFHDASAVATSSQFCIQRLHPKPVLCPSCTLRECGWAVAKEPIATTYARAGCKVVPAL